MKLLIIMSTMFTIILLSSYHPVMIMIAVLTQTMILCIMLWMTAYSSWFSYLLFLIFIGGIMILFVYITSLAANEKMNSLNMQNNMNLFTPVLIMSTIMIIIVSFNTPLTFNQPLGKQINILFSEMIGTLTLIMMLYLLLALIIVVKTAKMTEGPLRSSKK